jgi:protein-tyrosine phosphatase
MASLFGNKFPESFSYCRIEIEDSEDEEIKSHFYKVFNFIEKSLTVGGQVLVHCNAGVSRAGTVVTAYVMKTKRLGLKDALKFVRSKRKNNPTTPNDGFMKQLKKFEKQLSDVNKNVT